jgi:hypothetical protein
MRKRSSALEESHVQDADRLAMPFNANTRIAIEKFELMRGEVFYSQGK